MQVNSYHHFLIAIQAKRKRIPVSSQEVKAIGLCKKLNVINHQLLYSIFSSFPPRCSMENIGFCIICHGPPFIPLPFRWSCNQLYIIHYVLCQRPLLHLSVVVFVGLQGRKFEIRAEVLFEKSLRLFSCSILHAKHLLQHISNSHRMHLNTKRLIGQSNHTITSLSCPTCKSFSHLRDLVICLTLP